MKIKLNALSYNIGIMFIFLSFIMSVIAFAATLNINGNINTSGQIKQKGIPVIPSGAITPFFLTVCPPGWIRANGQSDTPDLSGAFVRGFGTPVGFADNKGSLGIGEKQNDAMQNITGSFKGNEDDNQGFGSGAFYDMRIYSNGSNGIAGDAGWIGFDSSKSPGALTDTETRPKNVALLYCVKVTSVIPKLPNYIPTPSTSGAYAITSNPTDTNGDGVITFNWDNTYDGILVDDNYFWNNIIPVGKTCSLASNFVFVPINGVGGSDYYTAKLVCTSGYGGNFKRCINGFIALSSNGNSSYGCK